ncbi:tRNA (N6-isopentenyl adenosine(37)-C2)-methylthiotransferase MiaB [Candidatus Annandia pinicola]|uniref:tRNA (N6-isopentenyl adenosine(37)-C2)-methylthiotransferase MiaB n=1 Tax=Candidatus Annandia pinicola TaxID=1345117 RepID=UPI001D01251C|nr:tRNA (N6-isopentenyl adenosine(37)-C2)-methylthiotransferase MiaB [Candidatus Annandia pinicola]UDG80343.1 tRNA-2-methylthio-N(6)-dimethylallyladenosine synthase [Candidatus Annandia pinicola]
MIKKLYIKTWGCQMNVYDSSKIINILNKKKYLITKIDLEADILILNTCSIRDKSQEKVFHQLGRWKKIKKKNPKIIICVGGCVASQEGEEILKRAKYVNIIFGPQNIHDLPNMIDNFLKNNKTVIKINFGKIKKFDYYFNFKKNFKSTALISIMEGCNKYCTFCIVPYTRGFEISRPCDDIIREIVFLSKNGVKEVNLLGQNVNAYKGKKNDGKICNFSSLLHLISNINGIERIRFLTSHPIEFTEDIIEAYEYIPKIVNFLHLPVQSGSNKILELMQRLYTVEEYKNIIKKITSIRPNIQISSDFIIGFPGETKSDFEDTMKLINDINFDASFSFIYSPRPGTPASEFKDNVSLKEKKNRLYILQNRINQQTISWSRRMLGSIQKVLVEGISKKNNLKLSGRTENNRIVNFSGNNKMIGKFIYLKITGIKPHSLRGEII